MNKRQTVADVYCDAADELLFLDPEYYDDAIIGVVSRADGMVAVCYSEPKVIKLIIQHNRMEPDVAMEYYQFNILGAYVGDSTPVFIDDEIFE